MIIDGLNVIDLAIGADRRIIEEGDAQLRVPSVIAPVLLNLRPTVDLWSNSAEQAGSVFGQIEGSRSNQAQSDLAFMTLAKGLWELEFTLSTLFSYTMVGPGNAGVDLKINYISTTRVLRRYPQIGSFVDFQRMRVLLIKPASIILGMPANGVGQVLDASATLNAVRVI